MNATGLSTSSANKYLSVLIDLHLIQREVPITEKQPLKSKKGLHSILDQFCHFWFKHVFPKKYELELGKSDVVLKHIEDTFSQHLGIIYERFAIDLLQKNSSLFFPLEKRGRWWDKNEEIDVVAFNEEKDCILFTEVKWTSKPVGTDIYEALKEKSKHVIFGTKDRKEYFCLMSKRGYTDAMIKRAKVENIVLFEGKDLLYPS